MKGNSGLGVIFCSICLFAVEQHKMTMKKGKTMINVNGSIDQTKLLWERVTMSMGGGGDERVCYPGQKCTPNGGDKLCIDQIFG